MVLTLEQTKTLLGSHKRFIKYFNMGMTMAHIKMQELRAVSRSCSSSALSGHGRRLEVLGMRHFTSEPSTDAQSSAGA